MWYVSDTRDAAMCQDKQQLNAIPWLIITEVWNRRTWLTQTAHYITSNDLGNDLRTTRSHTQLPKNNLILSLQIILNSMHKYQPRFHVILEETDKTQSRGKGQTRTFTFNETQFMAVTAYQNHMVSLSYHKKRIFGIALEITSATS